jgi:hypothetical protein
MRDIIKSVIKEYTQEKNVHLIKEHPSLAKKLVGCDFFGVSTFNYKWCKFAENKLSKSRKKAYEAIENYIKEYLSSYETGIRAVKYDKNLKFFSDRRNLVIDFLEKTKDTCPKLRKYVVDQMVKFTDRYVIWNEENQYDLLSKLNTNYSAIAYILTTELPDEYKTATSYEDAVTYFFNESNREGVTPFEKFMGKIGQENQKEIRDRIYQTIQYTTDMGNEIEEKFNKYISEQIGSGNSVLYSGDYSFMDMIGIDMMIKNPQDVWIPIQVKKWVGGCDNQKDKEARKHMCENWCVSNESKYFNIRVYDGDKLVKSKKQCKTTELDQTTFLNVHGNSDNSNQIQYCQSPEEE